MNKEQCDKEREKDELDDVDTSQEKQEAGSSNRDVDKEAQEEGTNDNDEYEDQEDKIGGSNSDAGKKVQKCTFSESLKHLKEKTRGKSLYVVEQIHEAFIKANKKEVIKVIMEVLEIKKKNKVLEKECARLTELLKERTPSPEFNITPLLSDLTDVQISPPSPEPTTEPTEKTKKNS